MLMFTNAMNVIWLSVMKRTFLNINTTPIIEEKDRVGSKVSDMGVNKSSIGRCKRFYNLYFGF